MNIGPGITIGNGVNIIRESVAGPVAPAVVLFTTIGYTKN